MVFRLFRRALPLLLCACLLLIWPAEAFAKLKQAKPESGISSYSAGSPGDLSASNLWAQSAILIDADTGRVLFSKKAGEVLYPASMTKIMTALLVVENLELNSVITVSKTAAAVGESKHYVDEGERIPVRDLMYGMLMTSSNSMAAALAEEMSGSVSGFAAAMTERAKELGCENTSFANPHGLTSEKHYTTVSDYAKIVREALKHEEIVEIIHTSSYSVGATNTHEKRSYQNSNTMLPDSGAKYAESYVIGGKTGYTNAAQHTFCCLAERDGVRLIAVMMGTTAEGKWLDAKKLFEYGFAEYASVSLAEMYNNYPYTASVQGAAKAEGGELMLSLAEDADFSRLRILVSKAEKAKIESNFLEYTTLSTEGTLVAPIQAGQRVATLRFEYEGVGPIDLPLVAARAVNTEVVAVTPPPTQDGGGLLSPNFVAPAISGQVVSGSNAGFPLMLVVAVVIPGLLFLFLLGWLMVEIRKNSKKKRAERRKQKDAESLRKYLARRQRADESMGVTLRAPVQRAGTRHLPGEETARVARDYGEGRAVARPAPLQLRPLEREPLTRSERGYAPRPRRGFHSGQ
ncbi:MAG: D-alanyl-D-alanine carboxypeptidase [Christensenellaceae bacterium]|jgi:D-alanyl-D-alanine carboxypeptidase|nr:D-alanyl-D-alanine carboxypeptidase [Christensenellaceae bacterium]